LRAFAIALSSIGNAQPQGRSEQANALSSGIGGLSNAALLYGLGGKLGLGGSGGSIYGGASSGLQGTFAMIDG